MMEETGSFHKNCLSEHMHIFNSLALMQQSAFQCSEKNCKCFFLTLLSQIFFCEFVNCKIVNDYNLDNKRHFCVQQTKEFEDCTSFPLPLQQNYCNLLPQTAQIYYLTVLGVRNPKSKDFPGCLAVKNHLQCRGRRFDTWSGN